jgi:hypothetical protein
MTVLSTTPIRPNEQIVPIRPFCRMVDDESPSQALSPVSVEAIDEIGTLLKSIDPSVSINWANRQFVGLQVGSRSANFVTFAPKKKFLRVSARFLEDTQKWMNRLQKAGFHIVGGTPGKSVRFRATKREVVSNKKLLTQVFTEGYNARTGKDSD